MFQGSYDEFRIYNTALNPIEVAASFLAGAGQPSTDPVAARRTADRESDACPDDHHRGGHDDRDQPPPILRTSPACRSAAFREPP